MNKMSSFAQPGFATPIVTPTQSLRRQSHLPRTHKRLEIFSVAQANNNTAPKTTSSPSPATAPSPSCIPRSLIEIDNGKILGFGADLSEDHPGYHDEAYKRRRVEMSNAARTHIPGIPIPPVNYTPEELEVWAACVHELEPLWEQHACTAFLKTYRKFNFSPGKIPQLEELNQVLATSGTQWTIRPTAGLLHPRDFLAGLAFRCFHSTQYIRHHSNPSYTPEPDLVHEALGHMPMLADPAFCDLAAAIGRASLGADDKTIWHLTKVYWYTVEFGVVLEGTNNQVKAFGAGILSSFGEMQNMASGAAEILPFDPFSKLPAMSYKDGYQKRYFALDSFESGAKKLKEYCDHVREGFSPEIREAVEEALNGGGGGGCLQVNHNGINNAVQFDTK